MAGDSGEPITGFVNFRDLGGHPTPQGIVVRGRVFRSDSLAHVSSSDVDYLVEERGIRTVVDLRGASEVRAFPNTAIADAGVTVHHVPLFDAAALDSPPPELATLTLAGLYQYMVEGAGTQFVEVLQLVAEPANGPLVFHCAAGKDRTGLVAAAVLELLDVDDEEIVADYAATSAVVVALAARAAHRAGRERAYSGALMSADASTMREFLVWLRAEHGGFEQYLLGHGLSAGAIDLLRTSLVQPRGLS